MTVEWGKYQDAYKAIWEKLDALTGQIAIPPTGKKIDKMVFGEDVNGNIREIKFYQNVELLFTLTFSNAGTVVSTWDISRS